MTQFSPEVVARIERLCWGVADGSLKPDAAALRILRASGLADLADSAQDVANLFDDAGQLDSDPAWIPVALSDLRQKLDALAKARGEA
jgi:hypothetical protein